MTRLHGESTPSLHCEGVQDAFVRLSESRCEFCKGVSVDYSIVTITKCVHVMQ